MPLPRQQRCAAAARSRAARAFRGAFCGARRGGAFGCGHRIRCLVRRRGREAARGGRRQRRARGGAPQRGAAGKLQRAPHGGRSAQQSRLERK